MNPVEVAKTILEKDLCKREDEALFASAFTGVVLISPTEESGVLLLYKGLNKFGNHTDTDFPKTCTNGLKVICLPKYTPDCKVTKETIGISIRGCLLKKSGPTESGSAESGPTESGSAEPIPSEPIPAGIWNGKELDYVQVPEGLKGWELMILKNSFKPVQSGFRYTLETNSHELILHGHEKHDAVIGKVYDYECCYLKYLLERNSRKANINECYQLHHNTRLDLKRNPPNSAIGPTARVKCADVHSSQELPQLMAAAFEVMGDIIELSLGVKFGEDLIKNEKLKKEVLAHFNNESNYCQSIEYPTSALKELEEFLKLESHQTLEAIQRTAAVVERAYVKFFQPENMTPEKFELCLQRVRVATDKMWSGNKFSIDTSDDQNYKDSYEKKLRDLNIQLVQILFTMLIKSDWKRNIISKFIEGIFRDQRYVVVLPKERHFNPLYKELQKLCWVMGKLVETHETTITTITESVLLDGSRNKLAEQPNPKIRKKEITTTTESETKLNELFQQYKKENMGSDWFGNLISLAKQLLDQWKQFVEENKGDPLKVDCKILKKNLNLKDDETAKKLVKRWFKEGDGPLSIMKVERLTTNASVRYYCWNGTLDYEDPFHSHNDTHIPLTMHGRGTVREDK